MGSLDIGSLNAVDILILAIFLISIIIGFGRGFVSEMLSLITLIAAFVIAIMFTNSLAMYFTHTAAMHGAVSQTSAAVGSSTNQPATYMMLGVSFGILFIATLIVGGIFKMLLNLMFQHGILGFGNRILGGLFGLVRGGLFVLALIFLVQLSPMATQPWWQQSQYVPYFQPGVAELGNIVSPALTNLKSTFGAAIENASDSVQSVTNTTTPTPTK